MASSMNASNDDEDAFVYIFDRRDAAAPEIKLHTGGLFTFNDFKNKVRQVSAVRRKKTHCLYGLDDILFFIFCVASYEEGGGETFFSFLAFLLLPLLLVFVRLEIYTHAHIYIISFVLCFCDVLLYFYFHHISIKYLVDA